eukprot:2782696-Rhodomonas_salina.1
MATAFRIRLQLIEACDDHRWPSRPTLVWFGNLCSGTLPSTQRWQPAAEPGSGTIHVSTGHSVEARAVRRGESYPATGHEPFRSDNMAVLQHFWGRGGVSPH